MRNKRYSNTCCSEYIKALDSMYICRSTIIYRLHSPDLTTQRVYDCHEEKLYYYSVVQLRLPRQGTLIGICTYLYMIIVGTITTERLVKSLPNNNSYRETLVPRLAQ